MDSLRDTLKKTLLSPVDEQARRARQAVLKRAFISAGGSLLPIPGADTLLDISVLVNMMNTINREFALSPQQIESLDSERRLAAYCALQKVGAVFAGQYVTSAVALTILKTLGKRWGTGKVAKWTPIVGQGAAALLSFGTIKYLGEEHIRECIAVRDTIVALLPSTQCDLDKARATTVKEK